MLYIGKQKSDNVRYELDPRALTTHGFCVGMTGSGKTGLCIALIEELRQAGVPTLILDPKGDMGNLALAFPDLSEASFTPWIDPTAAANEGKSVDQVSAETAERWRLGLAEAGIAPEQIAAMNSASPITIYTPGSTAGEPLNILAGLASPDTDDAEIQAELIKTAVNALLGLIGITSDPLTGREFILLSNILDYCWDNKEPADLERIIAYVQNPPMKRLGVFAVDQFYPENRRMDLALRLNGLLASPTFQIWMQGTALDIDTLLRTPDGKPRCAVVYLNHLADEERMFVISMITARLIAWMHRQPGSEQLRALLYIDEVAGLAPPHPANPPSKASLLTLFKQARAFGLGVMVATQNPMDLDYKIFSNAGVWMIGKLSTENDRRRIVEGLRGAAGVPDNLEELISGLGKRQFFIRNIHVAAPQLVASRFAMSFLRGPLTKDDIARLTPPVKDEPTTAPTKPKSDGLLQPPTIAGVSQYFLAPEALREPELAAVFRANAQKQSGAILYAPALYASCQVRFDDTKAKLLYDETVSRVVFPLSEHDQLPPFADEETPLPDLAPHLQQYALPNARYLPLPSFLDDAAEFESAERALVDFIRRKRTLPLFANEKLRMYSRPGESQEQFAQRCNELADEAAKERLVELHERHERKLKRLEEKRQRISGRVDDAAQDARARDMESVANVLETAAGFLFGRRRSIGRAVTSTMSKRRMAERVRGRQDQYENELSALEAEIDDEMKEMEDNEEKVYAEYEAKAQAIVAYPIAPDSGDIRPVQRAIIWVPII